MQEISKENFKKLNKKIGKQENNQIFSKNDLNSLLILRIHENEKQFTSEEINKVVDNLELFSKIYQLGLADCTEIFKRKEVQCND